MIQYKSSCLNNNEFIKYEDTCYFLPLTKCFAGLWKFNNLLLRDKEYVDEIKKVILATKSQYSVPIYNMNNLNAISNEELALTINDQLF